MKKVHALVPVMMACLLMGLRPAWGGAHDSTKPPPDPASPDDALFDQYLDGYWGSSNTCDCKTEIRYYVFEGSTTMCLETYCYPAGCGGDAETDCPY